MGLDDEVSDKQLAVIARDNGFDWERLRPYLGLSRAHTKQIHTAYPRDHGMQRLECLEVWKEVKGKEATYRALVTAAEEARDQRLADNVKDMLK